MGGFRFGAIDEICLIKATRREANCEWFDQALNRAVVADRSSGVGSVEQNVQNKLVASLEARSIDPLPSKVVARSSGSRADYIGSCFWSEFVVIMQ